jgi:tetratricopeptide (TPR) repeat protein
MGNLGRLLMDRHRFDEAQQTYEAALAASRKAHPEPHVDVGYLLADFGRLEFERKRYREAEAHYREALQIYRATLPPGHGYTAAALTMLGRTQLELRQPQEAEKTLQSALQEWSKEYGVSSPWYAQTRAFLGRAWALQRRFPEAEAALTETYPLLLRAQVDAEMTATVRAWIEDLYRSTGRPQQAQAYFQQLSNKSAPRALHSPIVRLACAAAIAQNSQPLHATRQQRAEVRESCHANSDRRRFDGRKDVRRRKRGHCSEWRNGRRRGPGSSGGEEHGAYEQQRRLPAAEPLPPCPPCSLHDQPELLATILDAMGMALLNRGCIEAGSNFVIAARTLRLENFGKNHPYTAASYNSYARVLRIRDELIEAEKEVGKAIVINRKVYGSSGLPLAANLNELGAVRLLPGRLQGCAEGCGERPVDPQEARRLHDDPNASRLLDVKGRALQGLRKLKPAASALSQALKLDQKQVGADHPKYATHRANLAAVQEALGDLSAAREGYEHAVRIYETVLGRLGHPNLIDTYANLGSLLVTAGEFPAAKEHLCKALGLNEQLRGRATRWSATITRTWAATTTQAATSRPPPTNSARRWTSTRRTSSANACRADIRTSTKR